VASSEGVRVVQGGAPQVQTEVRIDAITLHGRGRGGGVRARASDRQVQILLNNRPIQLGEIGPGGNGRWNCRMWTRAPTR
jgi:hypothetical protein